MSANPGAATSFQGRAQPGKLVLIFDGACPRCRASMNGLMALASVESIEAIDLRDPQVPQRFPNFRPDELLREIHAVDDGGRVWRGADAIRQALSRQSGLPRAISWLWRVPGFEGLADYLYRRVAASRHRDDSDSHPARSDSGACPLLVQNGAATISLSANAVKPFFIYNTLSRKVEEFVPLKPGVVTYYSCGPTVYLPQHLGNMRSYLFTDTLKRTLSLNGYDVRHVMNITDVGHMTSDEDVGEDKIEKTARMEGRSPKEVADFYTAQFIQNLEMLRIEKPTVPPGQFCRATEYVADMIALIRRILDRGYAYVARSGVYFDVEKWRGPNPMGRLSRQSLEEQFSEQRLEHASDKRSNHDFALWVLNQSTHLMQWDSPWGRGYPGWHIECSAMSMKYLGETIDIHSGGLDHVPIHHENEIAQSESATGKPFVRYFVHNAFLVGMEGAKISKSSGKFPVLADLVAAGIDPIAFRLFCFGAKYRSELAFSVDAVRAGQSNLDYFAEFARGVPAQTAQSADSEWAQAYFDRFQEALNNDLNTPQALAVVLDLVGEAYRRNDKRIWNTLKTMDTVLGIDFEGIRERAQRDTLPAEIETLRQERDEARKSKDFARADALRKELQSRGFEVKDTPQGTVVHSRRD